MKNAIVERALEALQKLNEKPQTASASLRIKAPEPSQAGTSLAACGSAHWAGCYSMGTIDGRERFIHTPKPGVKPEVQPLLCRQVEVRCWHCDASGKCGCITCAESTAPGPCVVCRGTGRAKQWVA